MLTRPLGEVVARGSRSMLRAYGRDAVVKVPEPATPGSWILAEAEYSEAVRAVGAPAARLIAVEEVAGRPATVWERLDGPSMWDEVVSAPGRAARMGRLLSDIQLALFELVPPVTLPSQRDRLASKIRRSAAAIDPGLARALDLLPARSEPGRLCHGDLHPSNVILLRDGPMLVDWFDASRGDRVADVARSSLTLLADGLQMPRHLPGADRRTLAVLTDAYLVRMCERLDIAPEELARWQAISAAARVAEGVSRGPLLTVWRAFEAAQAAGVEAQAAAS
jgi:aminoglycoside phosphotransferase (APT) family kinase protein